MHLCTIILKRPDGSGPTFIYPDYRGIAPLNETTIVKKFIFNYDPSANVDGGWQEIGAGVQGQALGFTTNFVWDGTSNILISWENNDGYWASGYGALKGGYGTHTPDQIYRSHRWYQDGSYPINNSSYNSYAPNIRLVITPL